MTEQPTSSESHDPAAEPHAPAADCPEVEVQLGEVIRDLNAFEAKKLPELKADLEAFIRVKGGAIQAYKDKYDDFLTRWRNEGNQIEQLRSDLLCSYPDDAWKKLIKDGVCPVRLDLHTCRDDIKALTACKGNRERTRDDAQGARDAAKTTVEAWKSATQKIDQALTYNQDLITQIQNLNQGQDRKFRVYLLWFKLLPGHNKLRPGDQPVSHPDETPEKLCGESNGPESPREAPWIVKPDDYSGKLDCAFRDYKAAKETFASAEAAFQAKPDDLASVTKNCDEKKKSFEDDVKKKLREATTAAMADGSTCS